MEHLSYVCTGSLKESVRFMNCLKPAGGAEGQEHLQRSRHQAEEEGKLPCQWSWARVEVRKWQLRRGSSQPWPKLVSPDHLWRVQHPQHSSSSEAVPRQGEQGQAWVHFAVPGLGSKFCYGKKPFLQRFWQMALQDPSARYLFQSLTLWSPPGRRRSAAPVSSAWMMKSAGTVDPARGSELIGLVPHETMCYLNMLWLDFIAC